ncbi:MAG: helix-turn-helix domain-containing protein [Planctomycetes bacterium]|nr:helix-turn-helix domain-containing protein [Planctomycetota bacterium]MBL7186482.1 helix-turn-helix domain-containing protein [Phycisphaerae bacterium]
MMGKMADNRNSPEAPGHNGCPVCKDLLAHMRRFFDMLEDARRASTSDWLTVEEIAEELRISKNVVYRLIRNGELEAINIVDTNGHIAQRGHYRINRADLQKYVAAKKVKTSPSRSTDTSRSRRFPKVRNHLGL